MDTDKQIQIPDYLAEDSGGIAPIACTILTQGPTVCSAECERVSQSCSTQCEEASQSCITAEICISCETSCQLERQCISCETSCQITCEDTCQAACEDTCQTGCEVSTQGQKPKVNPWSWTGSNGSATDTQTQNAYAILQGEATADGFSYKVWNDFVDKVMEVRKAKSLSWSTTGGHLSQSSCKVSAGNYLRAPVYNSVKYNINTMKSTGLSDVSADDDELTGESIVGLTDTLDEVIAEL